MDNGKSQRKHARIEIILKVEYDSSEGFLADYAKNASGGGISSPPTATSRWVIN